MLENSNKYNKPKKKKKNYPHGTYILINKASLFNNNYLYGFISQSFTFSIEYFLRNSDHF